MKTGLEICRERGVEFPDDDGVPLERFSEVGLPAVVACTGCLMTMALPSALVDEEGMTWCRDCGEVES